MATEVLMPQMGESIIEGTITRWLVEVGETVERDQPLLEISTDKVDAEIPSPAAGVLTEVRFKEGETVPIDTVLALIGAASESASETEKPAAEPVAAASEPEPEPTPAMAAAPEAEAAPQVASAASESTGGGVISFEERLRRFSTPVVRRIAAEHGVDLAAVAGSGIHGRVTKSDILAYVDEQGAGSSAAIAPAAPAPQPLSAAPAPSPAPAPPSTPPAAAPPPAPAPPAAATPAPAAPAAPTAPAPAKPPAAPPAQTPTASPLETFSVPAYSEGERVELEPMSRIRQITAAHMLYSQRTSAHVATVFDVDLTRVVALRNRAKHAFERKHGTKLTFMPFIFQAVIGALRAHPKFNASIDGTNIVHKRDVNLGMAVALDWGLIVPVIKNADQLSLVGLAERANDLAERARSKRLKPEDVQGGTFTITNPGVFGSLFGTPLINQPQVAILCVGAIEKRPVVVTDRQGNDALAIRSMAYLCLSYDHRLIDGADAERFMVTVKTTLTEGDWPELAAYS